MIVDVCFATTQNGVEFFAPRGDVDEVFADLVVFGGLLMRRDWGEGTEVNPIGTSFMALCWILMAFASLIPFTSMSFFMVAIAT